MSAFTPMTRDDAIATAKRDGMPIIVTIEMANGPASIPARSRMEAQRWVNFQRDWMYPGSDRIEAVADVAIDMTPMGDVMDEYMAEEDQADHHDAAAAPFHSQEGREYAAREATRIDAAYRAEGATDEHFEGAAHNAEQICIGEGDGTTARRWVEMYEASIF